MTEENKPTIRKIVFAVLLIITSISLLNSYNIARRYEALQVKYVNQSEDYRELGKTHASMTDQYWLIQQELLKQQQ